MGREMARVSEGDGDILESLFCKFRNSASLCLGLSQISWNSEEEKTPEEEMTVKGAA